MAGGEIVEGLEQSGLVQKPAKLVASKGKYFLVINKVRKELPVGVSIGEADALRLVGKPVTAVFSGRNIVAVGVPGIKKPRWTCYIPVPDLFKQIQKELQQVILNQYVNAGVITKEVAGKLTNAR